LKGREDRERERKENDKRGAKGKRRRIDGEEKKRKQAEDAKSLSFSHHVALFRGDGGRDEK
jgi:hypothetical protein